MIQIPAQAKVLIMHEPVDFRRGIDGMAAIGNATENWPHLRG